MSNQKIAIIIGAGPAGLTAALELLRHSNIKPVILEMTDTVLTPSIEYMTTHTLLGVNTVTAQTLTTPAEAGDNDKGKVCIKDTCLPTYSIVIMCVVVLIILCLCSCFC